jgi:hypothetical protein
VQIENPIVSEAVEVDFLRQLDDELRAAIQASLLHGRPELAVALDAVRDFVEGALGDEAPSRSRIGMARARAELALEMWRATMSTRH